MTLERLASAIHNNVQSGLRGAGINAAHTLEQIEDGIIQERLKIIKEFLRQNLIPIEDLMYSIRCIPIDCESLDRCPCATSELPSLSHMELPQIISGLGEDSIGFIGSTDGLIEYKVYTTGGFKQHKHKRRGSDKPYVWIDLTPNANNMLDAFIFNTPIKPKNLLVRIMPKDIRQLTDYSCCSEDGLDNISFIDTEIEKRLTEKYIRYYRQMAMPITPNDQTVKV